MIGAEKNGGGHFLQNIVVMKSQADSQSVVGHMIE